MSTFDLGGSISHIMSREISRFIDSAARGGRSELYVNRRSAARVHRSYPLLVARVDDGRGRDYSVTMANVSKEGVGFYCDTGFPVGSILGVKLFWSDPHSVRVPLLVCHNLITTRGVLVGGRFAIDDAAACELVEAWRPGWYG
jgi:hypothetical protein